VVRKAPTRLRVTGSRTRGPPYPHPMYQPQPAPALHVTVLPQAEHHLLPSLVRLLLYDPLSYDVLPSGPFLSAHPRHIADAPVDTISTLVEKALGEGGGGPPRRILGPAAAHRRYQKSLEGRRGRRGGWCR
jgi:hypothetical protein